MKRAKKQYPDISRLELVLEHLLQGKLLPSKFKDHKLLGKYASYRECHIFPDLLLIYKDYPDKVILHRIGSHSELFR